MPDKPLHHLCLTSAQYEPIEKTPNKPKLTLCPQAVSAGRLVNWMYLWNRKFTPKVLIWQKLLVWHCRLFKPQCSIGLIHTVVILKSWGQKVLRRLVYCTYQSRFYMLRILDFKNKDKDSWRTCLSVKCSVFNQVLNLSKGWHLYFTLVFFF